MVANIGGLNSINVEATTYITAVGSFAVILLVVLLFITRKWCYVGVFGPKGCDDVVTVSVRAPEVLDNGHFDALKPNHYPERSYAFETNESDDELRLRIQQANEDIGCHYEEKNENASSSAIQDIDLIGTALLETTLRETKIDDVLPQRPTSYMQVLEAQSSVESDIHTQNDTILLCTDSGAGQSRGSLELTLLYDAPVRTMTVHVLQAKGLVGKSETTVIQSQVRVVLLPLKKQKYKTKIRYGENPQYMESFVFHKINPEDVHGLGLRVRVYGCERMRRHRLLGEAGVTFASLNLEMENGLWLQLTARQRHQNHLQLPKPDAERQPVGVLASPISLTPISPMSPSAEACSLARSESASSCCSSRSAPELLLGLQYNPATGHLCVEIIKGTHFRKLSPHAAPDTYVKLSLISSLGMEMGRCKSTTRRAQSNPLYKELFIFQVALFQLSEVTLMVSVWWRRSVKRNEMVGWFSLGMNCSGQEEADHWHDACENQGHQIQRWHVLLDS